MAKKRNIKLDKGNWVEWEDGVKFLLRPFPLTLMPKSDIGMEQMLEMFVYCLLDWEGLEDEDNDKPIPCNDETKKYMFDYDAEIRDFVSNTISKIMGVEDKEKKN